MSPIRPVLTNGKVRRGHPPSTSTPVHCTCATCDRGVTSTIAGLGRHAPNCHFAGVVGSAARSTRPFIGCVVWARLCSISVRHAAHRGVRAVRVLALHVSDRWVHNRYTTGWSSLM